MQQTLLAVAAVLAFSFFALSQHRANASAERTALTAEVEQAATDVARTMLVNIAARAFDEVDVGTNPLRTSPTLPTPLSATLGPESTETNPDAYDDIDDFHAHVDTVSVDWHGETITFYATADVRYVRPDDPDQSSSSATIAKEVAVTVVEANPMVGEGVAPVMARLVQVITPAWKAIHG